MIDVARRSGAPLHVSHLKSLADERLVEPLLELLESAATSIDVTFDQYPYGAGSTLLASILPAWAQEGGAAGTLRALGESATRRRIAQDIANGAAGLGEHPRHARARADRDRERGRPQRGGGRADASRELADRPRRRPGDDRARPHARVRARRDHDPPLRLRRRRPHDREAPPPARRLGRDLRGASAPAAVRDGAAVPGPVRAPGGADRRRGGGGPAHSARGRPARSRDRGRIEPGKRADLVLLDPARYVDTATYADPCRVPDGVVGVWVDGARAWQDGAPTGARRGGVVR